MSGFKSARQMLKERNGNELDKKYLSYSVVDKAYNLAKIERLINGGRVIIKGYNEFKDWKNGSLVSYYLIKGGFRIGGFKTNCNENEFECICLSKSGLITFKVKWENVSYLIVGDPYKCKRDIVSFLPPSEKISNFPVKIDGKVVYYAKDNTDVARFKNTQKYKNLMWWYNTFNANGEYTN